MDKMANFMAKAIIAGVMFDAGASFANRIGKILSSIDEVRNARDKLEKTVIEKVTGETVPNKEPAMKAKNKIGFSIE